MDTPRLEDGMFHLARSRDEDESDNLKTRIVSERDHDRGLVDDGEGMGATIRCDILFQNLVQAYPPKIGVPPHTVTCEDTSGSMTAYDRHTSTSKRKSGRTIPPASSVRRVLWGARDPAVNIEGL